MVGHLFRTLHHPLVDPERIRLLAAQHHLLGKTARLFQRIFEDIVDLRAIATGARHHALFFQRLHRFTHGDARHPGQLAQIALAGQNIPVLQHPAAHRIFYRFGKLQVQRRVIGRGDPFIQLSD